MGRLYDSIIKTTPIEEGWSGDRKYRAETKDGRYCLLRISDKQKPIPAARLSGIMGSLSAKGIHLCDMFEYGMCDKGTYTIERWVNGIPAEEYLKTIPAEEQYRLGCRSGKDLKVIHSIPAPAGLPEWAVFFGAKIDRKIRSYQGSPPAMRFEGGEEMIRLLNAGRGLLKGRPVTFQHGDYHTGNMMVENGSLTIIDFDKCDWGDPWEKFNRIVWCAQLSPAFASGMVNGYFEDEVPDEFWPLLRIYIFSNTLSSVSWGAAFSEEEAQVMLRQANDVIAWYDGMKGLIPSWYMPACPKP